MQSFLLFAAAVSSISFTLSITSMFRWLRELASNLHPKAEELIHCPYCLSHWITFVLLSLTDIRLSIYTVGWLDFLITAFAVVGISSVIHYVLLRAYEPVTKAALSRALEKLKQKSRPESKSTTPSQY